MTVMRKALLGACGVGLVFGGVVTARAQRISVDELSRVPQTDAVVHDLCDKTVVMLGESPVHGFGKALDFKVALTRRLISECRFTGFFIESGAYDFLKIQDLLEAHQPVTASMIEAAIGGIWANQETGRLIPDLLAGAQSGRLRLGGLDDQLSRGSYAQRDMAGELVQYLPADARDACRVVLERHLQWQYTSTAPYGPKDTAAIAGCLDRIEERIGSAASEASAGNPDYARAMVANFKRLIARDVRSGPVNVSAAQTANARDRSMYENFQWLRSRMPSGSKIIVWTATTHAARDLSGVPGNATISMGSFIGRELGARAFALGFSEYSGSYAFARQPAKSLDVAPADSLEGRAFAGNDLAIRYFDRRALHALGPIAARPLGITFKTATWDDVLDGLVVFREEHPPTVGVSAITSQRETRFGEGHHP